MLQSSNKQQLQKTPQETKVALKSLSFPKEVLVLSLVAN